MANIRSNASLKQVAEAAAKSARRAHSKWESYHQSFANEHWKLDHCHSTSLFQDWNDKAELAQHVARHAGIRVATVTKKVSS